MPKEGYNQINNKHSVSLLEANNSSAYELIVNKDYKNKLTLNDSVLQYNDSTKSNYQKFHFEIKPEKKYKLTVSSLCNCLGFKKYIFVPQILGGNLKSRITVKIDSTYFDYKNGPLALNKVWNIEYDELKEITTFEFLLVSDNTKLSENLYKFIANAVVPINIKSTLIGDFVIKVEEY